MNTHKRSQLIIFAGVMIAGFLLVWFLRTPISGFLNWVSDRQAVTASIQAFGLWGPGVLSLLLILQVFIALVPGHALILAGSYVYGFIPSLLIALISTVVGSQIAFALSRRFGRALVNRLAKPDDIQRWDRLASRQGALFYFFAFVLPIFPSDLMCYVAGLGTISPRRFFIANLHGRFICAAFIASIGASGLRMPVAFWIGALSGLAVLFVCWRAYRLKSFSLQGE